MPFSSVSDAKKRVPSLKNKTNKQVKVFISAFNSMTKEGMSEKEAMPKAIAAANKVEKNMTDIEKRLEQVRITTSVEDMLRNFFGMFHSDAEALAKLLGFETEREYLEGLGEEVEVMSFEDMVAERVDKFEVLSKAVEEEDFDSITLKQVNQIRELIKEKPKDSFSERVVAVVDKYFGGSKDNSGLPVVKDLFEEEMVSIEPLYIIPESVDLHGDIISLEDTYDLVKSFNEANKSGILQPSLFHKHKTEAYEIVKAWVNEVDCLVGNNLVEEGQPLVKLQWKNPTAWKLRKEGRIMGPSIGARAYEIEEYE